jgi:hypothetical protein
MSVIPDYTVVDEKKKNWDNGAEEEKHTGLLTPKNYILAVKMERIPEARF